MTDKLPPSVAIIVLNWNGWRDAVECLESLQQLAYPSYQIILIDNGSTDDSITKIKSWCRRDPANRKLVIIEVGENKGFAGGNNVGITYALKNGYKYIWLLSNDTVVDKNALGEMIKVAQSDKSVGMVGSKFYDYARPDAVQWLGSNTIILPRINRSGFSREESIEFRWLCAVSLLVKREVIEQIGAFNENYFYFCEDKDWCIRARKKGWKLYCALKSKVWHKHGASTGSKRIDKYWLGRKFTRICWEGFSMPAYYESRNTVYLIKRNYPLYLLPYLVYALFNRIAKILLFDDHKIARISIILRSMWDGLIGRMGKVI